MLYINMKKLKIIIFPAIIIALIIPAFAFAQIFPTASEIASSMINSVMGAFVDLSAGFAKIAGSLLDWVISPEFISFSYTNPSGPNANPIVATGLDITKNFVNLGLVVALVFIAIAVSLQIGEYGTKKTFIKLVVVALLVNFAPVICGLVVDAANITMNYFLDGISNDISGALTDISNESLIGALTRPGTVKPSSLLIRGSVMVGLYFSIGLAFLLMVFIFVFRYISIWLLVILAPLAFVAWAIPSTSTKKLWSMWWQQLFQWSFIGIPMAFFLYLAATAIPEIRGRFESQVVIPGTEASVVGIVDQTFPYFVIVAFIYIGFFIGLKATAFGSSSAIRAAQWAGAKTRLTRIPQIAGGAAGWTAKKAAKGTGRWIEEKARIRERVGAIPRTMEKHKVLRWFTPKPLKDYSEMRPAIDEAQAEAKKYSSVTNMDDVMTGAAIGKRATGKVMETLARGDSQDIFDAGRRKFGKNLTDDELMQNKGFRKKMKRVLEVAQEGGQLSSVVRTDPRLAALATGEKWGGSYKNMTEEEAVKEAARQSQSKHINNWEKQVVSKNNGGLPVTEALMERGRRPFENIADNVKNGVATIQESIDTLFSAYIDNILSQGDDAEKEIASLARSGDKTATTLAWERYHQDFKAKHQGKDGFFVALPSERFRDIGYREGEYNGSGPGGPAPGPTPPPSSPGAATTMGGPPPSSPPPSSPKPKSNIPFTGKQGNQGKNKTDIPTSGKEGKG